MQSVICTHYDADTLATVTDTSKLFQLQTFKTFISEMYTHMYVSQKPPFPSIAIVLLAELRDLFLCK